MTKISISLPEEDVRFIDAISNRNRSSAVQQAIQALRERHLEAEYALAATDWQADPDAPAWDATAGDGIA